LQDRSFQYAFSGASATSTTLGGCKRGREDDVKRYLAAAAVGAALLGGVASTAGAADVNVNPFVCSVHGGNVTVPAGSTVVIVQGFSEQTLGILTAWLNDQTTTLSVNTGATVDLTGGWSSPVQAPDGSWVSFVSYPTGITLAAGDSMTVAFTISVTHVLPEVFNPAADGPAGKPVLNAGSTTFSCTVTGV